MKQLSLLLAPLLFTHLLTGCAGSEKNKGDGNVSWTGKMQTTAQSFQELLPYLYSEGRFNDKKNSKKITKKIANFRKSIHRIDGKAAEKFLGDDPYVLASIRSLQELTERAEQSFARGDRKNSRILLKATTNTCFKCHTRQNMGPQTIQWKNFDVAELNTDAIEKAHILVSMRQYEDAKLQLKEFLSESEDKNKFDMHYENALHYYLMISLRGQTTFKDTLNFIQAKILVVKTPTQLHYTLKHWHKDLKYWNTNKAKLKPNLNSALNVIKRNKERYSERNLVNNLVASALLHEYLMKERTATQKAKAYRLLGQAYDELIIEGFWDLPEVYYEQCIHNAPKTKLSKNCFKSLRNNIMIGYSGSRGTLVPNKEYERLEVLRKKAGL